MPKKPTTFVVTAALTDDGAPAFLAADGQWSRHLVEAQVFDKAGAEAALQGAQVQERTVCDPYVVGVWVDDAGKAVPASARERIRAEGPTTRLRRPDGKSRPLPPARPAAHA